MHSWGQEEKKKTQHLGGIERIPAVLQLLGYNCCATTTALQLLPKSYCFTYENLKRLKFQLKLVFKISSYLHRWWTTKQQNISMIKEPLLLLLMTTMIKIVEADKRLKLSFCPCFCPGCKNGLKSLPGVRHLVGKTKNPFQSLWADQGCSC